MVCMSWEWKKPGIMLPEPDWDRFEAAVERLYGKKNKGRRKYLYAVAMRLLLSLDDDEIKRRVHQVEGEEHDVLPSADAQAAAELEEAARSTARRRRGKRSAG